MNRTHEIEIGRVVIEGPLPEFEARTFAEAFEHHLATGLGRDWEAPSAWPPTVPVDVAWPPGTNAAEAGRQAALGVARAIRRGG